MRTLIRTTVAVALTSVSALALSGTVLAGNSGERCHSGYGHAYKMDEQALQERAAQRFERLQARLELRDDQQQAWQRYKQAMQESSRRMYDQMQEMRAGDRPDTMIERMKRRERMGEDRLNALREMRRATEGLYAELDDSQRDTLDEMRPYHGDGEKKPRRERGRD